MHVPSLHAPGVLRRHHLWPAHHAPTTRSTATDYNTVVRFTRAVTALVALATALLLGLWTLAAFGYADADWWAAAVIGAMSLVAGLAAWILARGS